MAKKRILIIDGPLGGGGAERVLIDILRNVDYDRFDVDLALICRGGALMDEVPPQVNVIGLWNGYSLGYKLAYRMSRWLRSNWLFARKINGPKLRRDYDVEISFLEGMPLKLHALRTSAAKKVTWVHADLDTHRYEAAQFYPGEELRAYNNMDVVVNVSGASENAFRHRFPDCRSEMRIIYNPVDREKILSMASDDARPKSPAFTVVTVGRLTSPKNPTRFLDIARMAKDAGLDIRFKWIGDGELRGEVEARCAEMGLGDMVEFTGFVKNPFGHIASADALMVTSDYESFCMVICEAMCLGVPVVSTRTAGPSEIIGDDRYGFLTDFSAEQLFDRIRLLYNDEDLRTRLAEKAKARPDDFSVEKTLKNLYSLV